MRWNSASRWPLPRKSTSLHPGPFMLTRHPFYAAGLPPTRRESTKFSSGRVSMSCAGRWGRREHVEFEVTDAAERTFNFEMPKPEQPEQPQLMPLAGSVVNRETGRPVAGPRLTGVYRYESLATLEVITDEHGAFKPSATAAEMSCKCWSPVPMEN